MIPRAALNLNVPMSLSSSLLRSRYTIAVAGMLLLAAVATHAQRRRPVPSSDEERWLLSEGIALHNEKQDVDGAIAKYREVLARNRDNIDALFELALCYYEKGAYRECLETSLRGAEYESDELGYFYNLAGNSYDELRQPQKAVAAYREGIKAEPNSYLLRYNLAVTYLGLKRIDDARESFKRALLLNPNHTSSHLGLGQIYLATGYRVPALLAFCRALILEPASGRGEGTIRMVDSLLGIAPSGDPVGGGGAARVKARRDEGNFQASERVLLERGRGSGATEIERLIDRLRRLLAPIAAGSEKSGPGFAAEYYAPFFAALYKEGYLEPMAYHISQSMPKQGVADWLSTHELDVRRFLTWSRNFSWRRAAR